MKTIRDLLLEADPLRYEPSCLPHERNIRRQALLVAASGDDVPAQAQSRARFLALAMACIALVVASLLGDRADSLFVSNLQAAVRFEVTLAEKASSPGLREVRAPGSDEPIYLHQQPVVSNGEIESARLLTDESGGQYSVGIEFTDAGAEKIFRATEAHIGNSMAILIDDQVVMLFTVRSPISKSAVVTGDFTKAEAERIVNGVTLQ